MIVLKEICIYHVANKMYINANICIVWNKVKASFHINS